MSEPNAGRHFVAVLSTFPGSSDELFPDVVRVEVVSRDRVVYPDDDYFARVSPPLLLVRGDSLNFVDTCKYLESGVVKDVRS